MKLQTSKKNAAKINEYIHQKTQQRLNEAKLRKLTKLMSSLEVTNLKVVGKKKFFSKILMA